MKFKETYRGDDLNLSLGRFYNTDIRKLVAFRQDYPKLFADEMEDPQTYLTSRVQAPDTIYFALRYRRKVVAYGAFDPIGKELATMQFWRKKWEKIRRHRLIGLGRLMLEFGFKELGFRRVTITAAEFATTAANIIKETGFTQEGTLRKFCCYDHVPTDILVFGILKEEF